MRKVLKIIDAISLNTGNLLKYFSYALVLVITYEVVMRYVFNVGVIWTFDISIMLGGTMYILSWGYAHLRRSHIRVDVFYIPLSPRGKAVVDVIGTVVLAFPLLIFLMTVSFSEMMYCWKTNEKWGASGYWYPPMGPFKTMVWLAYCLFTLQVIAQFVRDLYLLVKRRPYD